ncbi:acyl-CoA thioester hydrolase/BAAT C-terminal domain-containing protein [Oceanobacillus jeddahense]|uniref:acyl-CoA thioester hydrolase/BAAT C-terminal domain-containing protein n=1 Tax=Oceanobacillus jeddahense TaxID=1462527 RepID=UPI000595C7B1|nr:acyl-CoA thioester hydrolase/BAAT C-terminal domain-containing protein [Oceanobacillus jeddahense]
MSPKLQISSIDSYMDETIYIKVIGCSANTKVSIHASTYDEAHKQFHSYAAFIADDNGVVDVSLQKPVEGTYDKADAFGLFWSMDHTDSKWGDYYQKSSSDKVSITLVLKVNEEEQETVTIYRHFYREGVIKETVQHHQLKGTLFHPEEQGNYPAVLILSGSDGGMQEHAAALLASKGYTALALAYFGEEGVPKDLEEIPLEYFQEATRWLKHHEYVNGDVSLIGYSRGGELALLLGATFNDYQSIIAGVPSAYITPGMKNGIFAPITSWIFNQEALPAIKFKYPLSMMFSTMKNWLIKKPISFSAIWEHTLKDQEKTAEARIPVENIQSPVMFISGGDDQLWPSSRYVNLMEKTRKNLKKPYQDRYLYYEHGGHFLSFPYSFAQLPANVFMQVGGGMTMTFGGTKEANADAAKDSWDKILEFLAASNRK